MTRINFINKMLIICFVFLANMLMIGESCKAYSVDFAGMDSVQDEDAILVDTTCYLASVEQLFENLLNKSLLHSKVESDAKLFVAIAPLHSLWHVPESENPAPSLIQVFSINLLSESDSNLSVSRCYADRDSAVALIDGEFYRKIWKFVKSNSQKSYSRFGPIFNSTYILLEENGKRYCLCLDGFIEWSLSVADICEKLNAAGIGDSGLCELIDLTRKLFQL